MVCVEFFPSELRKYAMDVALRVELNNNKSRYRIPSYGGKHLPGLPYDQYCLK